MGYLIRGGSIVDGIAFFIVTRFLFLVSCLGEAICSGGNCILYCSGRVRHEGPSSVLRVGLSSLGSEKNVLGYDGGDTICRGGYSLTLGLFHV
jgi:hypothetical protein